MKLKATLVTIVIILVAPSMSQGSGGSQNLEQPLSAAIDKDLEKAERKFDFLIDARQVQSKSEVVYAGEVRAVEGKKKRFLELWIKSRGLPEQAIELLSQEAKFVEGEKEYWMPVRGKVLDEIMREMGKGDRIKIHTLLAGGVTEGEAIEWVFIVGEYSK